MFLSLLCVCVCFFCWFDNSLEFVLWCQSHYEPHGFVSVCVFIVVVVHIFASRKMHGAAVWQYRTHQIKRTMFFGWLVFGFETAFAYIIRMTCLLPCTTQVNGLRRISVCVANVCVCALVFVVAISKIGFPNELLWKADTFVDSFRNFCLIKYSGVCREKTRILVAMPLILFVSHHICRIYLEISLSFSLALSFSFSLSLDLTSFRDGFCFALLLPMTTKKTKWSKWIKILIDRYKYCLVHCCCCLLSFFSPSWITPQWTTEESNKSIAIKITVIYANESRKNRATDGPSSQYFFQSLFWMWYR